MANMRPKQEENILKLRQGEVLMGARSVPSGSNQTDRSF